MIDIAKLANLKICVAVSGGRDSMALLHCLYAEAAKYKITLSALNCDHGIRGEQSARDSAFVKEWCSAHKIPLIFFKCGQALKTEAEARNWRRECYKSALAETGADAIATAHHMDDNAETILFNLARGSALAGMAGITDDAANKIIHPLVCVPREEIDRYVKENGVPFVEDETNLTDDYTRNKIRHNVLPELEKAVPGAAKAIYRFSRLAADDEEYFDNIIRERGLVKRTRHGAEIKSCKEKVIFKRAAIKALEAFDAKDYTAEHAERLYRLQFSENGKKFGFLGFTAFKEAGKIVICANAVLNAERQGVAFKDHLNDEFFLYDDVFIYVCQSADTDDTVHALRAAAEDDERVPEKLKILKFDGDKIPAGAVIRFMQPGDKFTKFGGGTKSLGDFFTDRKIPVRVRRRVPVIAEGNEILAVGGVEISEKIKITENTENTLYLICADYGAD